MAFRGRGDGIAVQFESDGKNTEVCKASHLLLAVGRVPNTEDLGLKEAGIAADARGYITVDDQCRTSAEGVWCMGDANGRGAFTHTSWNDYEIVAANLFDNDPRKISDRIPCYALFIDPPLGRVGMNEAEARKSGRKLLGGKMPMTRVGRAREMGETQGFMKVLVDADTKELLGAAILGLNGDEIVHSLLDVMYAKKPYTTIQRAVHIHPTVTELVPTLLGNLKPMDEPGRHEASESRPAGRRFARRIRLGRARRAGRGRPLDIAGVSAASAGSINAVVYAQGHMTGGNDGARAALEKFWKGISEAGRLYAPAAMFLQPLTGLLSPYQFNPFDLNPLREVLAQNVDMEALRACDEVELFVCATNVRSGQARIFAKRELTLDMVLASACVPHLFRAVEVEGEAYWDGGYMGNPPIYPLIYNTRSRDIVDRAHQPDRAPAAADHARRDPQPPHGDHLQLLADPRVPRHRLRHQADRAGVAEGRAPR